MQDKNESMREKNPIFRNKIILDFTKLYNFTIIVLHLLKQKANNIERNIF